MREYKPIGSLHKNKILHNFLKKSHSALCIWHSFWNIGIPNALSLQRSFTSCWSHHSFCCLLCSYLFSRCANFFVLLAILCPLPVNFDATPVFMKYTTTFNRQEMNLLLMPVSLIPPLGESLDLGCVIA